MDGVLGSGDAAAARVDRLEAEVNIDSGGVVAICAVVVAVGGLLAWINRIQVGAIDVRMEKMEKRLDDRIDSLGNRMQRHEDQGERNHESIIERFHDLRGDLSPIFMDVARLKERIFGRET